MSHDPNNPCHALVCMPPNWNGTFCPVQIIEMTGGIEFSISSVQTISSDCGGEEEVFQEFDGDFGDYNFHAGDIIEVTLSVTATGNSWLTGNPCVGEMCVNGGASPNNDGSWDEDAAEFSEGCYDCEDDIALMNNNKSYYTKTYGADWGNFTTCSLPAIGPGIMGYYINSAQRLPRCYFPYDEEDYSDRTIVGETITVSPQSYSTTITQFWIDSNTNSIIDFEGPCELIGQVPPNDYGETCYLYRDLHSIFIGSVFDTIRLLCGLGGPMAPECPTEVRGILDEFWWE